MGYHGSRSMAMGRWVVGCASTLERENAGLVGVARNSYGLHQDR